MHEKLISVIIPVYNGSETISSLVDKLIHELAYRLEIVLVNDGSIDNSEAICIALYEQYPAIVRFYSLAKNVGEHNAVMAGLNQSKGDYAVIIDDDFQNPVSEVYKLIAYGISQDFDAVFSYYDKKYHSFWRNIGSQFNNLVASQMLHKPRKLYLSSFKIINRFLIDEVIKYTLPFPYIDGLILRSSSHIGQIKLKHQARSQGRSGYTLYKLIALWMNMFTNFSVLPLRLSIFIGFIFSIVGFLMGISTIMMKIYDPSLPMGYASLMFGISIFSGIQLIAIGMVGEYIGRIFLSINKQAQFSIRKIYDNKAKKIKD